MKKFFKFLFGTAAIAALAAGAYTCYKKYVKKDETDDFDDFEDDLDDDDEPIDDSSREYVSINITSEGSYDDAEESTPAEDTPVNEE